MNLQIFCPYCGNSFVINVKHKQDDILCELCGSNLKDHIQDMIKNMQTTGDPLVQNPTPNIPPPISSQNNKQPYQNQHGINGRKNAVKSSPDIPAFPISQMAKQNSQTISPQNLQSKDAIEAPPKGGAWLIFPQINQKILIPPNISRFHFGRNSIIPLVNPANYDVDWLNSISRIRLDSNQRTIAQHFTIYHNHRGEYTIEDRNSKWGTWVNGVQIRQRGRISIKHGAKIEIMLSKPNVKTIFPFTIQFRTQ